VLRVAQILAVVSAEDAATIDGLGENQAGPDSIGEINSIRERRLRVPGRRLGCRGGCACRHIQAVGQVFTRPSPLARGGTMTRLRADSVDSTLPAAAGSVSPAALFISLASAVPVT
jgi:hypothetical protein